MIWIAIGLVLVLCTGAGLAYGGYRAAQSPAFYGAVIGAIVNAVLPVILASSPETQAEAKRRAREGTGNGDPRAGREK